MSYAAGPVSGSSQQEFRSAYVTASASYGAAMVYDAVTPTAGEIWTVRKCGSYDPIFEQQFAGIVWNHGDDVGPNRRVSLISAGYCPQVYLDVSVSNIAALAGQSPMMTGPSGAEDTGYLITWLPPGYPLAPPYTNQIPPCAVALEAQASGTGTVKAYILRK